MINIWFLLEIKQTGDVKKENHQLGYCQVSCAVVSSHNRLFGIVEFNPSHGCEREQMLLRYANNFSELVPKECVVISEKNGDFDLGTDSF